MSSLTERLRAKHARIVGPDASEAWYRRTDRFQDESHFVYRIYDADGLLLYIGCTYNLSLRIDQHYSGAIFNTQMDHWTGWRYPNRGAALAAEAEAIRSEHPYYNVLHSVPDPRAAP